MIAPVHEFVMVRDPPVGYAGRRGDHVIVTDETKDAVYVRFDSGIAECYPPIRFAELFLSSSGRMVVSLR